MEPSLAIYCIFSLIWGVFAATMQATIHGSGACKVMLAGIVNAIFAPVCMMYAIFVVTFDKH